eukprot:scaffold1449_cov60-Cyclotella_meneghiniana.AAC.4
MAAKSSSVRPVFWTRLIAPNDNHIVTSIKASLFQENSGRQGINKDDCLLTGWCGCHMFC